MARPRKAQAQAKETKADLIDKLVKEVDPEVLLAGALGAIAAQGGITPPLTRLLMVFDSNIGQDLIASSEATKTWYDVAKWGSPLLWALGVGNSASTSSTESGAQITSRAMIASGALEAMLMMNLVKNPETLKAVLGTGKELVSGLKVLPV